LKAIKREDVSASRSRWGSGAAGGNESAGQAARRARDASGGRGAAMAASRHSNSYVVTASGTTSISAKRGEFGRDCDFDVAGDRVFNTSMEVA